MGRRRKKKGHYVNNLPNRKIKTAPAKNEDTMESKEVKEAEITKPNDPPAAIEENVTKESLPEQNKESENVLPEAELLLPGGGVEEEDGGADTIDSESTTSVSTIECPEEDLERSRRYSNTPPKKHRTGTSSSPNSTTSTQSTSQAGGGGGTTRSRQSSVSTSPSRRQSPSPTPSSTPTPSSSTTPNPPSTSTSSHLFPVRLGISWRVGSKVEAMDYIQKWYPARIVEINADQLEVLIHFEGWNSRYDEWLKMSSDRLRPLARHSERKESKKTAPKTTGTSPPFRQPRNHTQTLREYKAGECVFAKWTDCRHYAARILAVNPSGSYEVMFYDGFRKTVQPINVKVMPPEVQVEYANAGLLPPHPKTVVKRQKEMKPQKNKDGGPEPAEKQPSRRKSASSGEGTSDDTPQRKPDSAERHKKSEGSKHPKKGSIIGVKRRKLFVGGAFSAKRVKMHSSKSSKKQKVAMKGEIGLGSSLEDYSQRGGSHPGIVTDPLPAPASTTEAPIGNLSMAAEGSTGSQGVKERSEGQVTDLALPSKNSSVAIATEMEKETNLAVSEPVAVPSTSEISPFVQPIPAQSGVESGVPETPSPGLPASTSSTTPTLPPIIPELLAHPLQPRKAFRVEEDHNRYKCPFDSCNKGFRKETLLEYHIKYYHTEDGRAIPPPPPRKRKKTSSICSTDSEISVGGRSTSSKRRKRPSEASLGSLSDAVFDRLGLNIDDSVGSDLMEVESMLNVSVAETDPREVLAADDMIALGEEAGLKKDEEVVNCICQLNEENGLMIQCEVCLCWQHASCMELTEDTLPKRYVCYVCTNPPGIRESARFMYVQDWFREGKLSSFNFVPPMVEAGQRAAQIYSSHGLVSEMHGVDRVLDSLRRKINILQEKNHPEFHFWTKNWDREIEKKRQEEERIKDIPPPVTPGGLPQPQPSSLPSQPPSLPSKPPSLPSKPPSLPSKPPSSSSQPTTSLASQPTTSLPSQPTISSHPTPTSHTPTTSQPQENIIVNVETDDPPAPTPDTPVSTSTPTPETPVSTPTPAPDTPTPNPETPTPTAETPTPTPVVEDQTNPTNLPEIKEEQGKTEEDQKENDNVFVTESDVETSEVPDVAETTTLECHSALTSSLHDYSMVNKSDVNPQASRPINILGLDMEADELESDVSLMAGDDDPSANCEKNLLEHIMNMQDRVANRLDLIEEHVAALEALEEQPTPSKDVLSDMPLLKKKVHHLLNDLVRVKRMSRFH